jgi:hypothetical protein
VACGKVLIGVLAGRLRDPKGVEHFDTWYSSTSSRMNFLSWQDVFDFAQ